MSDLEPPIKILVPTFTPLRNLRDPESRRRRRREQEAKETREQHLTREVARCRVDWLHLRERLTVPALLAVLDLHQPEKTYSGVTCEECASYDRDGLSAPDWPCATVQAITSAPEGA